MPASTNGEPLTCPGSGQLLPLNASVETILITPFCKVTPVSGLLVRSVFTERVRRPSGVSRQPQHSDISWKGSNTAIYAQTLAGTWPLLPPTFWAVPGLVIRNVASGAPLVLALAK